MSEAAPALSGVGNHEAKSLLAVGMSETGGWHSTGELNAILVESQGSHPSWPRLAFNTGPQYCEASMANAGVAEFSVELDAHGNRKRYYRLTEYGETTGVEIARAAITWSVSEDRISVQGIFGQSSRPHAERGVHPRYELLKSLVNRGGEASFEELRADFPEIMRDQSLAGWLHPAAGYTGEKILEVISKQTGHNPDVLIADPNYDDRGRRPFHMLQPETQAIYKALGELSQAGHTTVPVATVCERAERSRNGQGDLDMAYLKKRLLQAKSGVGVKPFPGITIVPPSDKASIKHNGVRIVPSYLRSIKHLVGLVAAVESGNTDAALTTESIMGDTELCSQLMAKARNFSPRYQAHMRRLTSTQRIEHIFDEAPGRIMTLEDVLLTLDQAGVSIKAHTVHTLLHNLQSEGLIQAVDLPFSPVARRRKHMAYRKTDSPT